MIDVINEIRIYERNGNPQGIDAQKLKVKNHWNESSKIVLYLNGEEITVVADDLIQAIKNASNTNRY